MFGCHILFRQCGIEIWKQNNEFLVLNRFSGYAKFYKTLDEAKLDDLLVRTLFGVKVKPSTKPSLPGNGTQATISIDLKDL